MTATHRSSTAPAVSSPVRAGMADAAPFALAIVPFGLAIGVAGSNAGLSLATASFGLVALLAGASQLAAIETLESGGGVASVVLVVVLINMRFVLYGGGVATWFRDLPLRRRLLLAYPIVDQTFLLCQQRFTSVVDVGSRQRYFVAATAVLVTAYVGSHTIAFSLGSALPDGLGLHLAAPLAFAGMLTTAVKARPEAVAAAAAAVVLVAGAGTLGAAALPVAVIAGVAAGSRASAPVIDRGEPS